MFFNQLMDTSNFIQYFVFKIWLTRMKKMNLIIPKSKKKTTSDTYLCAEFVNGGGGMYVRLAFSLSLTANSGK